VVKAWESYRAACASDWWWWYGDDRSSDNDYQFDRLFRRLLQSVYLSLGLPVPDALRRTFITTRPVGEPVTPPSGPLHPPLDGRASEREWAPAGVVHAAAAGTMGRAERGLRAVRFGAGGGRVHLLLEPSGALADLLDRAELAVEFAGPRGFRYRVGREDGGPVRVRREERRGGAWRTSDSDAQVAAEAAVQLAIPVRELDARPGAPLQFQVALLVGGTELERHPEAAPVAVTVEEVSP
jgi:hypothetical protein